MSENIQSSYRILEVIPKSGIDSLVRYFNTETKEYFEKIDQVIFEVPSRKFTQGEHGDLNQVLKELKERYPEIDFVYKRYNKDAFFDYKFYKNKVNKQEDIELEKLLGEYEQEEMHIRKYVKEKLKPEIIDGKSYVIRAYMKDRSKRKTLDYMIGLKKDKQLFITNINKNQMARSILYDSYDEALESYQETLTEVKNSEIISDDVNIKESVRVPGKYMVEVQCTKKQLKELNEKEFRILRFESEKFTNKKDAEKLQNELYETQGFKENVEKCSIAESTDSGYKKKYHLILSVADADEKSIVSKLKNKKIFRKEEEFITLEKNADPFQLNSPRNQLLNMFPIMMKYDPDKSLQDQINLNPYPFPYASGQKDSELEKAVNDALGFYTKKTCAIDLEVTDWLKDKIPSGRVYAAILNSESENKLYVTKDLWKKKEWISRLKKDLSDKVEIVFLDDEIELIARLYTDSKKYMYHIMHNGKKYDFKHLSKFNDKELSKNKILDLENKLENMSGEILNLYDKNSSEARKLIDEGKRIADEIRVSNRIKEIKKKYNLPNADRLWKRTVHEVIDTLIYAKYTWSLLPNNKLSSITGFTKQENYEELEEKINSPNYKDKLDIFNYTIEDGFETTKANKIVLKNAILTSLLANRPLPRVFSNNPLDLFYNAGDREYELRTGTYSKRHEISYERFKQKMNNRKPVKDIMANQLKIIKQKRGVFNGKFSKPNFFLMSYKDVIENHPVSKFMFESAKKTNSLLEETDLLLKIDNFIRIAIDKSETYMKEKGLEFGKAHSPEEVYLFMNASDEEEAKRLSVFQKKKSSVNDQLNFFEKKKSVKIVEGVRTAFSSDNQFAEANKTFSAQYGVRPVFVGSRFGKKANMTIPLKSAVVGNHVKKLAKNKILAYSEDFIVSQDDLGHSGYFLGDIKGINLSKDKKTRFIGRIEKDGRKYEIYKKVSKPKDKLILDLIDNAIDEKIENYEDFLPKYQELLEKFRKKNKAVPTLYSEVISAIYGVNPEKSSGTGLLFPELKH